MLSRISAFELSSAVIGIALNSLLLHLISKYSKPPLGSYKHLLRIFACYDIFMAVLLAVVQPISYSSGYAIGVFSRSFPNDAYICSLSCSCTSGPFTLMNINFLHRYWAVKSTHKLALFSNPHFQMSCFLYPIIAAAMWYCASIALCYNSIGQDIIRRSITESQHVTVTDGWQILYIWENGELNVRGLGTMLFAGSVVLINLTIGCILFVRTVHHLRTEDAFSATYRMYQFKILRALLAQSAIPVIFVYIPVGIGMSLPLLITDERKGEFDVYFALISIFPALDATVIILLMKDYRDGLLGKLRPRRNRIDVVSELNE